MIMISQILYRVPIGSEVGGIRFAKCLPSKNANGPVTTTRFYWENGQA